MAKIWNADNTNVDEDVEQPEFSFIAHGNPRWCSYFGR